MAETTPQAGTTEQKAFVKDPIWDTYKGDNRWPRKHWKGLASLLAAAGVITGLAVSSSGNHRTHPRAVAAHASPSTTVPPHASTGSRQSYIFAVEGGALHCVVDPSRDTIEPGQSIYGIMETHLTLGEQSEVSKVFLATIAFNQHAGLVGTDPNLIYAGHQLELLEDCTFLQP